MVDDIIDAILGGDTAAWDAERWSRSVDRLIDESVLTSGPRPRRLRAAQAAHEAARRAGRGRELCIAAMAVGLLSEGEERRRRLQQAGEEAERRALRDVAVTAALWRIEHGGSDTTDPSTRLIELNTWEEAAAESVKNRRLYLYVAGGLMIEAGDARAARESLESAASLEDFHSPFSTIGIGVASIRLRLAAALIAVAQSDAEQREAACDAADRTLRAVQADAATTDFFVWGELQQRKGQVATLRVDYDLALDLLLSSVAYKRLDGSGVSDAAGIYYWLSNEVAAPGSSRGRWKTLIALQIAAGEALGSPKVASWREQYEQGGVDMPALEARVREAATAFEDDWGIAYALAGIDCATPETQLAIERGRAVAGSRAD